MRHDWWNLERWDVECVLRKGEMWSVWSKQEEVLIVILMKVHQRRLCCSTSPSHVSFQFCSCDVFNFVFVFLLPHSLLLLNTNFSTMYFQHFSTSPSHALPPRLRFFILAFIRPKHISTFSSTVPHSPSLDSVHRTSFPSYFNPLRFSSSHPHIHSSIPSFWLSEPQQS